MSLPPLLEHIKQANAALSAASNNSMDIAKQCAASRKAEMSLPLPETEYLLCFPARPYESQYVSTSNAYSEEQLLSYGQACTTAERDRFAELCDAAKAVIDRWDSPSWKDQPHTAEYIARLRAALEGLK